MTEPRSYIWLCEKGHECAISELEMELAIVEPECKRAVTPATNHGRSVCGARLRTKVRPFPEPSAGSA